MKKKWPWQKIVGTLLMVIGIVLLAINFLPNPVIHHNVQKSHDAVGDLTAEDIRKNDEEDEDASFDFSAVDNISPTDVYTDQLELEDSTILGQLVVPQVELNMTIFKGVSDQVLYTGVGTMRPDVKMGAGNYSLAGHYDWNDRLLHRLNWIKSGDVIRITDKDKIYEYVAVENDVVEPTATELITDEWAEDKYGQPIISLMNCFFPQRYFDGDDDRYFVFGVLVNETDYSEDKMNNPEFNWDSQDEKQEFEENNPSKDENYHFDEYKENQWKDREETLENK